MKIDFKNFHSYIVRLDIYIPTWSWCGTGGSVSPLIKGLRFEPWIWRKSCWERHSRMGPAMREVEALIWTWNIEWKTRNCF